LLLCRRVGLSEATKLISLAAGGPVCCHEFALPPAPALAGTAAARLPEGAFLAQGLR